MEEETKVIAIETPDIIKKIEEQAKEAITSINEIAITDNKTLKHAADGISLLKKLGKKLKSQRTETVRPYKDGIKTFEKRVNLVVETCDEALKPITKKYQDYVAAEEKKETARLEAERIALIKQQQADAAEASKHMSDIEEQTGVDLSEQKEDVAAKAIAEINNLATMNTEVKTVVRSNIGTISTKKKYVAEVCDPILFLKWIIRAHEAGVDHTGLIKEFSKSGLNSLANQQKYKDLIDKAPGFQLQANGLKLFVEKSLNVR